MYRYTAIVILVGMLILTATLTTFFSYRNAGRAAEDSLKSEALGVAASLDTTLARYGTQNNIFTDVIQSQQWEGISYLALYGKAGLVLLHSNRNLIGRGWNDPGVAKAFASGGTSYSYKTLATEEKVFVMDTVLHFGREESVLRVALHTYPAQKILRQARLQLLSTSAVVTVLSVLTIFFLLSIKKREGLEKELLRKQKLSAIGEMSAVLAHEIRNPLGSIKGCAQYLRELNARKGLAGQIQGYLDVMVSESLRLERLTEDLLCYAREYTIEQETFNLYDLVSEVVSSLTIPRSVSVDNLVREGLMLTSDKGKVRQVAINLLQNALDALQAKGSVTLRGEEVDGDVLLTVEDSGAGMNDETKAGIFRPFYTTKSKGTGLGLAIVDRYVAALGGKIEFESAVGRGSTFNVRIPARPDGKSRGRHA